MAELNAGSVCWRYCDRLSPRVPGAGHRHSGIGFRHLRSIRDGTFGVSDGNFFVLGKT
jgi:hypothetical protein